MVLPNQLELQSIFSSFLFESGLSAVSVKNYLSDLRHFFSFCFSTSPVIPGTDPESIPTVQEVSQSISKYLDLYLTEQKKSFTPQNTINRRLASIRRFSTFMDLKFGLVLDQKDTVQSLNIKSNNDDDSLPTITKILDQFRHFLEKEKKTHSTVKNYVSDLNHFFAWSANSTPFMDQNLENLLSESQLNAYVTYLRLSHTSTSVINRRQSSIKQLTKYCFLEKYIPTNPFEYKYETPRLAPLSWFERFSSRNKAPKNVSKSHLAMLYQKYNSLPFTPYLHLAILALATSAMVVFGYNQIVSQASPSSAALPTVPRRQLSFQGRLTSSSGTPITTAVDVVFKLYSHITAGSQLYTSGTCAITGDTNGIFNTIIGGGTCGSEITSTVFTENRDVYLEVSVGAETLTPRQQIATVGYALNTETLQGYPASATATINTVPIVNSDGNIIIAAANPDIISSSGTFTLEGQALTLQTASTSGGDVVIQPDAIGGGEAMVLGSTTSTDTFRIQNANLTSGNLISGYVGNNTATGRLLSLTAGSTETDRFYVAHSGQTKINTAATLANAALIANQNGTGDLFTASASGATKFIIGNGGNITATGTLTGLTGLTVASGTVSLPVLEINNAEISELDWTKLQNYPSACSAGQAIQQVGDTLTCIDIAGASGNLWQLNSGALTPLNITNSINLGATATASALVHLAGTAAENSWINTGNVGIGTTSPGAPLEVNVLSAVTGFTEAFRINSSYVGAADWRFGFNGYNDLNIRSDGTDGVLYMKNTGLVGIGTTNPGYKLDVNGSLGVGSTAYFASNVGIGTTAPSVKLHIVGNGTYSAAFMSGNVGIGTVTPDKNLKIYSATGASLSVSSDSGGGSIYSTINVDEGTGAGGYIRYGVSSNKFSIGTTGGGDAIYIDRDSSNVGIGQAGPGSKLSVQGGISVGDSSFTTVAAPTGGAIIQGNVGIGTTGPNANLEISNTTGSTLRLSRNDLTLSSGEVLGSLEFYSADASTNYSGVRAKIDAFDNDAGGYGGASNLAFYTSNEGVTNLQERMRIDKSGNLGIGTTAPGYKLEVNGSLGIGGTATFNNKVKIADGTQALNRVFTSDAAGVGSWTAFSSIGVGGTGTANYLSKWLDPNNLTNSQIFDNSTFVGIGGTAPATTPRLYVAAASGNVGIGTTNPGKLLELRDPNTSATGQLRMGDGTDYFDIGRDNVGSGDFKIYYKAAHLITIETDGRFGIGTVAPLSKLGVLGNASIGATYGAIAAPTSGMIIEGNVGIGTTAPGSKLHVIGTSDTDIQVDNTTSPAPIHLRSQAATYRQLTADWAGIYTDSGTSGIFISDGSATGAIKFAVNSHQDEAMRITSTGNVGIGTTAPGYKLEVNGSLGIGGTATFNNKVKIADGTQALNRVFTSDAAGVGSWTAFSSIGVGGTGTANYLSKWLDPNNLTNSQIFDNSTFVGIGGTASSTTPHLYVSAASGNVGIGTTAPTQKLEVNGSALFATDGVQFALGGVSATNRIQTYSTGPTIRFLNASDSYANLGIGGLAIGSYATNSPPTSGLIVSGNVGIGTTNPVSLLDVYGVGGITKGLRMTTAETNRGLNLFAGTASPDAGFLTFGDGTGWKFYIGKNSDSGATKFVTVQDNGNVGIGTTAPGANLDVRGTTILGATSKLYLSETTAVGELPAGAFLGGNYDNFSFYSYGGIAGKKIGAYYYNQSNYLSAFEITNPASGYGNLLLMKSGGNVGIGTTNPAGKLNIVQTGATEALRIGNTNGGVNMVILSDIVDYGAGLGINSTDHYLSLSGDATIPHFVIKSGGNVGIGTTNPQYKLQTVGTYSDFYFDGGTTAIIGTNYGSGSNISLYNASTGAMTLTANNGSILLMPSGNVGIGTTNPSASKLEVAGQVKITGGTPGANKVLTSDANGLATWETVGATSIADDSLDFTKFEDTMDLDANLILNQAAYTWVQNFTGTTTTGLTYNANSLTTGTGLALSSTSTALSTGGLMSLDWSPGSATTSTGDLFSLNIGTNGTVGNLFNVKDTGSSLFSISETAVTSNLPTSFTSAGDVSIAYDLNFTNPTASYIKSAAPLYLQAGETFGSSDLTLKTFNAGDVVLDAAGGVTLAQAQAWDLADSSTTSLNIESGLMNFDTTNSRVGIGTTAPQNKLHIYGASGSQLRVDSSATGVGSLSGIDFDFGTLGPFAKINSVVEAASDVGLVFYTTTTGAGAGVLERMRINHAGNLGIGTTAPGYKLSVIGTSQFSGNILLDGLGYNNTLGISGGSLSLNAENDLVLKGASGTSPDAKITLGDNSLGGNTYFTNGGNEVMRITGGGNLGIGTTAPGYKLEVNGSLGIGGTATFNNKVKIADGTQALNRVFTSDAAGVGSWTAFSSIGVGGTGTANYLSKWLDPNNLTNSQIFDNSTFVGIGGTASSTTPHLYVAAASGNVGIGTTNPGARLDVAGSGTAAYLRYNAGGNLQLKLQGANNTTPNVVFDGTGTADLLNISDSGTVVFAVKDGGNVGIGTTAPIGTSANGFTQNANSRGLELRSGSDAGYSNLYLRSFGETVGLDITVDPVTSGTVYFDSRYAVGGTPPGGFLFRTQTAGTPVNALFIEDSGNVGIGTTTPGAKLELSGGAGTNQRLKLTGTANGVYTGIQMINTATGVAQWDIGVQNNVLSGSLVISDDGGTTKRMVIDRSGNVGIGTTSPLGKLQVQGGNTLLVNSDYDNGAGTGSGIVLERIASSGNTNSSIYGFTAGGGGNGNLILQRYGGNVGIGTTAPGYKLEVNGSLGIGGTATFNNKVKIADGTQALNRVFTSDAAGVGSWTAFSSIGVGGTGTANYLSKWLDPNNLTNSQIFDNSTFVGIGGTAASTAPVLYAAAAGNVGIGTTNPSQKLEVAGDVLLSGNRYLLVGNTNNTIYGTTNWLNITGQSTLSMQAPAYLDLNVTGNNALYKIQFSTQNTERMRIDNAGNVGIGTTNPGAKLEIGSGQIFVPNGTAAAPSYAFTNDPDTGLFKRLNSYLMFAVDGVERAYVSGGNFVIPSTLVFSSTNTPASVADVSLVGESANTLALRLSTYSQTFNIYNTYTDASNYERLSIAGNAGSAYTITSQGSGTGTARNIAIMGGNVGIGTTAPIDKFQVAADNSVVGLGEFFGANLVFNGGAEDGTTGWTSRDFGIDGSAGSGTTNSTTLAGSYSFQAANDGGLNQNVELIPGAIYTLSARMRVNSQGGGDAAQGYLVVGTTATGREVVDVACNPNTYDATPNTNKWVLCSASFTATNTADVKTVTMYAGFRAAGSTHIVLVDNVSLTRGGNTAGYSPITTYLGTNGSLSLSGSVGIGTTNPTAALQIKAGTTTVAPLKFTSGTNLTTGQAGAMEYDGAELYFTPSGTTRETVAYVSDITAASHNAVTLAAIGSVPNANGMSIDGSQVLNLQPASATYGGAVTTGTQTFAGAKTLTSLLTTVGISNGTTAISNSAAYTQSGVSANTFTGTSTFSNATYSALFTGGNVGIGTTAPDVQLTLLSGTEAEGSKIKLDTANQAIKIVDRYLSNDYTAKIWASWPGYGILNFGINDGASSDVTTPTLSIRGSGNVGIGTTNPIDLLHVSKATLNDYVSSSVTEGTNLRIMNTQDNWSGVAGLIFGNSGATIGTGYAKIGAVITNTSDSDLTFQISNNSVISEALRISSTGNVGIGTTAPAQLLDVGRIFNINSTGRVRIGDTTAATRRLEIAGITGGRNAGIALFEATPALRATMAVDTNTDNLAIASTNSIQFYAGSTIGNTATEPTNEIMRITNTGNVGIGTTSPGQALEVNGRILATGSSIYVTNANYGMRYIATGNTELFSDYATGNVNLAPGASGNVIVTRGNVGIGTTGPGAKLHVAGTVKIVDGSQGANKILTSDANGLASWSTIGSTGITPDSLDFSEFKDAMTLDASTNVAMAGYNFTFNGTGNVGIGTTAPRKLLDLLSTSQSQLRLSYSDNALYTDFTVASSGNLTIDATGSYSNLILNPGFETVVGANFSNWNENPGDSVIEDSAISHSGSHAVKITAGPTHDANVQQTIDTLVGGVTYTWSFWTRGDGTYGGRYFVIYDGSWNILAYVDPLTTGTTYTQYSGSFVAPLGNVRAYVYYVGPNTTGGISYVDDVSIIQTSQNIILQPTIGNVGIGTTTPGYKLEVNGSIASKTSGDANLIAYSTGADGNNALVEVKGGTSGADWLMGTNRSAISASAEDLFFYKNVAGTGSVGTKMVIKANGNVGIGYTNPASKLDIDTGSNTAGLRLRGLAETTEIADLFLGDNGNLIIDMTAGADTAQYIDLRPEDNEYGLVLRESDGTGTAAYANFYVVDAATDYMNIIVGAAQSTTGLVINSAGNVGIGTTGPLAKLHVGTSPLTGSDVSTTGLFGNSVAGTAYPLTIANSDTPTTGDEARMSYVFGTSWSATGFIGAKIENATNAYTGLTFGTYNGSLSEKVRIDASGNVGIGTSTPVNKLSVSGNANFTGNVGIGTTTPTSGYALDVAGSMIQSGTSGSISAYSFIARRSNGGFNYPDIYGSSNGLVLANNASYNTQMALNTTNILFTGGNVGIGTTNPSASKLEVAGQVKITGGTPGANKVLTSDANGLATWETVGATSIADDSLDFTKFEDTMDLDANLILNQAAYTWVQNFTGTTTTGLTYNANSLTTGTGLALSSTSTALSTGGLMSLDWSPGSATTSTGDLFSLNIGTNGTVGNLFNVKDTGSSLFSISETAVTSNLPTSFTSAGDVSIAYDLNFTNPTASYIKSAAPLYLQAGETFGSSDLTLKTFNAGDVVLDAAGGVTLAQAQAWDLADSSTTSLNIESGLINFDTTNSRVGIGTTNPSYKLDVNGSLGVGSTAYFASNVGIGTTAPNSKLDVYGVLRSSTSTTNYAEYAQNYFRVNGSATNFFMDNNTVGGSSIFRVSNASGLDTTAMQILSSGNVGIGTTSPQALLDVNGLIRSTATTTSPTSGAGTEIYGGTGINYIQSYNRSSPAWLDLVIRGNTLGLGGGGSSNSLFINASGNVGIGTTNPLQKLQVAGDVNVDTAYGYRINNTATSGQYLRGDGTRFVSSAILIGDLPTITSAGGWTDGGAAVYLTTSTDNVGVGTSSPANKLSVVGNADISGNLGIGTTAPSQTLQVSGNTFVTAFMAVGGNQGVNVQASTTFIASNGASNGYAITGRNYSGTDNATGVYATGYITSGTGTSYGLKADISNASSLSNINVAGYFSATATGGTAYSLITGSGNVGIGTATPGYKLSVAGNAYISTHLNVGIGITTPAFTMVTGAGANKVFTSDASGNGVWTTLTTLPVGNADTVDNTHVANGTTNFVAKYSDASHIVTSSILYDNGTNVGIGTTAPGAVLELGSGNILLANNTQYQMKNSSGTARNIFSLNAFDNTYIGDTLNNDLYITSGDADKIYFRDNGTVNMTIDGNTGNVGIGTTNPGMLLDVVSTGDPTIRIKSTAANANTYLNFVSRLGSVDKIAQIYADWNGDLNLLPATNTIFLGTNALIRNSGISYINGGNVGIGTTGPATALDVNGVINAATGYRIANAATSGNYLRGNGTNFVSSAIQLSDLPSITAAGGWTDGGASVYLTTTADNVGIGTSTPLVKLHVVGDGTNAAAFMSGNVGIGTTTPGYKLTIDGAGSNAAIAIQNSGAFHGYLMSVAGYGGILDLYNNTGTSNVQIRGYSGVNYINSGNVGIGTTNPDYKLKVIGTIAAVSGADGSNVTSILGATGNAAGWLDLKYDGVQTVHISSGVASGSTFFMNSNVGIGTTAPTAKLHVVGGADTQQLIVKANATQTANLVEIQKSDGTIYSGSDNQGRLFSYGGSGVTSNLFFGSSGNPTLSGTSNVAVGSDVMTAATTATSNLSLGANSMNNTTTGGENVAIGTNALRYNQTGHYNVSIGDSSGGLGTLAAYSSSAANTMIGYQSGYLLRNGMNNNIFIGAYSGDKQTTLSNLLIIDNQTRADIATEKTNSIIYGIMAASPANQTLLLNANVGIGITNPLYSLDVTSSDPNGIARFSRNGNASVLVSASAYSNASISLQENTTTLWQLTSANADADSNSFRILDSGSTARLVIQQTGNVGIGTTGPGAKLGFAAATTAAGGIDFGGDVNLYRAAANVLKTDDELQSGSVFYASVGGADQVGVGVAGLGGGITFGSAGDTNIYRNAANVLRTGDSLIIDGNVGIGTTNPGYKLVVADGSIELFGTGGSIHPLLTRDGTSGGLTINSSAALGTGGALTVQNNGSNLFRITDQGNVGIGTTAPLAKLEIGSGNVAGANVGYSTGAPTLVSRFDGPKPDETDFTGNPNGSLGQAATQTGGVIFRPGKFGKGVQIAEATTNLVPNPSIETNTTGWNDYGGGAISRVTTQNIIGVASLQKTFNSGIYDRVTYPGISVTGSTAYTISMWVRTDNGTATPIALYASGNSTGDFLGTSFYATTSWVRKTFTITTGASDTTLSVGIYKVGVADTTAIFIDGVQLEQKAYATPYADGSLGNGHSWSGTAHASTSSRTAASLTYATGTTDFSKTTGSVSLWVKPSWLNSLNGNFRWIIDNNYTSGLIMYIQSSDNLAIYLGGSAVVSYNLTDSNFAPEVSHHLVVTWDTSANQTKLYLDGVQIGSTGTAPTPTFTNTFYLGSYSGNYYVGATLDDFAVFPTTLSAQEIYSIYKSNAPIQTEDKSSVLTASEILPTTINGSSQLVLAGSVAGNVGIGTTAPGSKLSNTTVNTITDDYSGANTGAITWYTSQADTYAMALQNDHIYGGGLLIKAGNDKNPVRRLLNVANGDNTSRFIVKGDGNVGIGTTGPLQKLNISDANTQLLVQGTADSGYTDALITLQSAADGRGRGMYMPHATGGTADSWFAGVPYGGDLFQIGVSSDHTINDADGNSSGPYIKSNAKLVILESGNVGIGTTAPGHLLNVVGTNNTTPFSVDIGAAARFDFTANSTSSYTTTFNINDTGVYIGHNSASRSLSLQTSTTDRLTILGGGNVGIGLTAPLAKLQVEGNLFPGMTDEANDLGSAAYTWSNLFVTSINNTSGTQAISVNSKWLTGGNWNVSTGGLRIGDTTALTGGWKLYVSGNATVSGTLQTGDRLTVAGGSGKIDVGEIDPPYTINGDKFATYMTAMVGIKEEIAGHVTTDDYVEGVGYRTLIDLDQQPKGSDLWLFSQIIDIDSHIGELSVLLTPEGQAKVWYEIDKVNNILAIYSSTPTNITYRLTAPRFDHDRLKSTRPADDILGIVINNPNVYTNIAGIFDNITIAPELLAKLDGTYTLKVNGKQNFEVSSFLSSIIANLKVGVAVINNLVADNLTVKTKLISPLADIGQLKVKDAEVSGTLYADNIKGQTVDALHSEINILNEKYSTASGILASLQAKYSTYDSLLGSISEATVSGNLSDPLALSPLTPSSPVIPQDLALNSLNVHTLIGNDIMANGAIFGNSISAFDSDLFIQPTGDKPVHLLANLMILYPDGKVLINGDLLVAGSILAQGLDVGSSAIASDSAQFTQLTTKGLIIAAGNDMATNSGTVNTNANATIGTATIASGSSELSILNTKVTPSTLIYITPTSDTNGRVLFVKSKVENVGFTVGLTESTATSAASFNYWLVETK